MSGNRRIAKNSLILYIQLITTTIVGLLSARIVLQNLGASDFGLYSVVGGIVLMLNIFNAAMTSASYRFIAFEIGKGDVAGANKVFNISLIIHACLALLVVLLAETFGAYYIYHYLNVETGRTPDAMFVFRLSVIATVFSIFIIPFQALVIAHEIFFVRSLLDTTHVLLRLAAAVMLIFIGANQLRLYSVLIMLAYAITAIMYVTYCRRKYNSIVAWELQTDLSKYREMVGFSGWVILGAVAGIGRVEGAALIINLFFGTVLNAAFAIANRANQFVLSFSQNLAQAAWPQIVKSYSSGNIDRTMQLVCYMPKYTFFLMLVPALPILLETEYLLGLWLGKVPEHTALFCQLMIAGALIDSLSMGFQTALEATGKIKYFHMCRSAILFSGLPVSFILLKFNYPPYTILLVYIVISLLIVIVNQILLKKLINLDIKRLYRTSYLSIIQVIVCACPLYFIKALFYQGFPRFIFISFTALIWLVVVIWIAGLDRTERLVIKSGIMQVYHRFSRKDV